MPPAMRQVSDGETRAYYDDFSTGYESERHRGYHALIDELEVGVAVPLARGGCVLEVGSVTELPFRDESFDLVVSFKVLAHVPDIDRALAEVARVTRPGGRLALEFYN